MQRYECLPWRWEAGHETFNFLLQTLSVGGGGAVVPAVSFLKIRLLRVARWVEVGWLFLGGGGGSSVLRTLSVVSIFINGWGDDRGKRRVLNGDTVTHPR